MTTVVELPLWLLILILLFAAVTFASHFLFPSVRWFFRRRMQKAVAKLNTRLERPIEPFKLARRYDMIQRLIYDPEVSVAIAEYARKNNVPENVAFEKARRYAREIVPSFSATAYFSVAIRAAKALSLALYRVRMGRFHDKELGNIDRDATVIFVMNHRSNMDYVLVTWLAAERSALSYAVGEWARVWPLSRLIKAMGAYFIRRKSRDSLYRRVLSRYVGLATDGGVTQAVFPEGGLSLDGALAEPKLGILKYIIEERSDFERDVVFVPVAVNYDRVFEDKILVEAGQAGHRRFGAKISVVAGFILKQFWLWITRRYHRHGYAAASFGAPVSLSEFQKKHPDAPVEALGEVLMQRIGEEVPVLPVPLIAYALTTADGPMTRDALCARTIELTEQLSQAHVHVPRDDLDYAVEVGTRNLLKRNLIKDGPDGYMVVEAKRAILSYYANSITQLFR
ncbi:1-acyl-sn-glycerol-3-phosphate acyltransferase [Roseovarius rhodophyticola]|uniref:Glycerol-3-phosphate acyltransferase n=1 Tax=Roseovarius rhodophyticola TaxID=3080827 RepID=A0ABZ2TAE2_9RHOB|nr:1-acyl-sn-glycerol-3-phosphate acyltransferase [Roseovarius sp. W115]MDV2930329.1 1-acyl-sn-glycerol-3-phosphate acyltransferase [Roseovarius sp. W115]